MKAVFELTIVNKKGERVLYSKIHQEFKSTEHMREYIEKWVEVYTDWHESLEQKDFSE